MYVRRCRCSFVWGAAADVLLRPNNWLNSMPSRKCTYCSMHLHTEEGRLQEEQSIMQPVHTCQSRREGGEEWREGGVSEWEPRMGNIGHWFGGGVVLRYLENVYVEHTLREEGGQQQECTCQCFVRFQFILNDLQKHFRSKLHREEVAFGSGQNKLPTQKHW